jgi:hypothetical protein
MKTILKATLAILALVGVFGAFPCSGSHDYPRLINIYTYEIGQEECDALSQWDVVVLSTDVQHYAPEFLGELRAQNPDIKILAYFPAVFVWSETSGLRDTRAGYVDKVEQNDWWLYDNKGNPMGTEGYLWFTNFTCHCPVDGSGRRITEWLADYISDEIIATGYWDGVLIDGLFENPNWINDNDQFFIDPPAGIDSDRDGTIDDPEQVYGWWLASVEEFLSRLRQNIGYSHILIGNDKNYQSEYLNGGIRENFPNMHGDWSDNMFSEYGYITMSETWLDLPMNCTLMLCFYRNELNTTYEPHRTGTYERKLRFTLTSSLLGDGYYLLEGGSGSFWWEDLYDVDYGEPLGPAYLDSIWAEQYSEYKHVWVRDFANATVYCNPFDHWVVFGDGFWLRPEDGRVLTHSIPGSIGMNFDRLESERDFDQNDDILNYSVAVSNPSNHAAFVKVWARLTADGDTLISGAPRRFLIGKKTTTDLSLGLRTLAPVAVGRYCLEVFVGGDDCIPQDHDTLHVRRVLDFEKERFISTDSSEVDYLTVCPQPVSASGGSIRMEVVAKSSEAKACVVRLFDIRGRIVRTVYQGEVSQGLNLDFGMVDEGGEQLAPGLYFLSAEIGKEILTRKVVLLR